MDLSSRYLFEFVVARNMQFCTGHDHYLIIWWNRSGRVAHNLWGGTEVAGGIEVAGWHKSAKVVGGTGVMGWHRSGGMAHK